MVSEATPLLETVAGYGPPVIFLAAPWLLLGLMLSGPFALLVILVVFTIVAATAIVALSAAILAIVAAPYLFVRRRRGQRPRHASGNDEAAQLVRVESPRVVA